MSVRRAIVVLGLLVLANCGSSPKTHYFTLDVVPGTEQEKRSIASPVTVAEVHLPPSLDRREMVRRTGANTADISGQDRWTAPLGEMIRSVLSQDLAAHLPKDKVVPPDSPAPPRTGQIVVSIVQFGTDGSGRTTLDCNWSLLQGSRGAPALRRDVTLETHSTGDDAGVQAAAMSQLLGQLAARIATALAESG
jgi:uncharacterized lipoprotein YmbA